MMNLVNLMQTIKEETRSLFEVKKSKFISILKRVDSLEEIEVSLKEIKKEYPLAKHYVYAYILEGKKRCSDDAEPSKTAGPPILHVLEKKEMDHILCVVVRYFGGILLGAGGLVRAYSKSATDVLNQATIVPIVLYRKYRAIFSYTQQKKMEYLLKDTTILERHFAKEITYVLLLEENYPLQEIKQYAFLEEI